MGCLKFKCFKFSFVRQGSASRESRGASFSLAVKSTGSLIADRGGSFRSRVCC
jgi:hypothetical protein